MNIHATAMQLHGIIDELEKYLTLEGNFPMCESDKILMQDAAMRLSEIVKLKL